MKVSTREDIEAPIEHVFGAVTDFDSFERQGMRRGAEVVREDPAGLPGLGTTWAIRAQFRGRPRNIRSEITMFDPPNGYIVQSVTGGLQTEMSIELLPLAPRRTRLIVGLELRPNSLPARLVVQSLKLAKTSVTGRMKKRTQDFARRVEDGLRNGRG